MPCTVTLDVVLRVVCVCVRVCVILRLAILVQYRRVMDGSLDRGIQSAIYCRELYHKCTDQSGSIVIHSSNGIHAGNLKSAKLSLG